MQLQLAERMLEPGTPEYGETVAGYNLAARHRALAFIAEDERGVQAAVRLARREGRRIFVQSTGHGTGGSPDDGLLVITNRLTRIEVDAAAGTARVGSGVRWGELVDRCGAAGLVPLGMASEATVGVAGYTLGGGTGPYARSQGFAADHVVSIEMVDLSGQLRTIDSARDPDLFWALRGGRDGFGVVTALTIRLTEALECFGATATYPTADLSAALSGYLRWQQDAPEQLGSSARLLRLPGEQPVLQVRLDYAGPEAAGRQWLARLAESAPPAQVDVVVGSPARLLRSQPAPPPIPVSSRSILLGDLPPVVARAMLDEVGPDRSVPLLVVELRSLGGAAARTPAHPNAVGGRDGVALVNAIAVPDPAMFRPAAEAAGSLFERLRPWSLGRSLLNFDPLASATCWDAETRSRLDAIRSRCVDLGLADQDA